MLTGEYRTIEVTYPYQHKDREGISRRTCGLESYPIWEVKIGILLSKNKHLAVIGLDPRVSPIEQSVVCVTQR